MESISLLSTEEILKHPHFEILCRSLRNHSRSMDLGDIIEALKVMIFLKVPTRSEIIHILFNLLRQQINDIELGQMVFLDFLLERCDRTPLVEAFRIALPMLFQINVGTKLNHENVTELAELLVFAVKHECSDQSIQNIVSALTLHGMSIDVVLARSIIWSLSDHKRFKPTHEKLLQNCIKIVTDQMDQLEFLDIESTLSKISYKVLHKFSAFYNEEFFKKVIEIAIERDLPFNYVIYLFKKFNRMNYTSDLLLEMIAKKFTNVENSSPSIIFTLVSAFSFANYIPMNWSEMSQSIVRSKLLENPSNNLPWLKFTLELVSLGTLDETLLGKIFSEDFLTKFLQRDNPTIDYMQLLSLYQILTILHPEYKGPLPHRKYIDCAIEVLQRKEESPLREPLKFAYGPAAIHRVMTKHGHLLDHIIVFDKEGNPIPVERNEDHPHLDFIGGQDRKLVAVLPFTSNCYSVNTLRLKGILQVWSETVSALGLKVLPINTESWSQLMDHEKIPYLQREIKFSIN
ncbi:uncharacterized protein LOC129797532 isoform X2 [Lutzomyia longipalpis]|uniref:uncharacterized protein LOC129797532 isoform X2 n=1 Tax=Lutzomyia longipalpis TaxID=7200 RepID=UPI002483CE6D|nr:uncharacterized protein LOC129797532 isoform X2 [Lutzomyia longipalpis]